MTGTLLKRLEQHIWWSSQKHVLPPRGALRKPKTVTTTVAEGQDAEILILRELQRSAFKNEIASLRHKEQKPRLTKQSRLLRLDPFIDDQGL